MTVSKTFAVVFALSALFLICMNIYLFRENQNYKYLREAEVQAKVITVGSRVPMLNGLTLGGKEKLVAYGLDTRQTLILTFDVDCRPCEANWPYWRQLIADVQNNVRVVAVNVGTGVVSTEYARAHHLESALTLAQVSPASAIAYKFGVTPETMLVGPDAVVRSVWTGVLGGRLPAVRKAAVSTSISKGGK